LRTNVDIRDRPSHFFGVELASVRADAFRICKEAPANPICRCRRMPRSEGCWTFLLGRTASPHPRILPSEDPMRTKAKLNGVMTTQVTGRSLNTGSGPTSPVVKCRHTFELCRGAYDPGTLWSANATATQVEGSDPGTHEASLITSFHVLESFHSFSDRHRPFSQFPLPATKQLDITE